MKIRLRLERKRKNTMKRDERAQRPFIKPASSLTARWGG